MSDGQEVCSRFKIVLSEHRKLSLSTHVPFSCTVEVFNCIIMEANIHCHQDKVMRSLLQKFLVPFKPRSHAFELGENLIYAKASFENLECTTTSDEHLRSEF